MADYAKHDVTWQPDQPAYIGFIRYHRCKESILSNDVGYVIAYPTVVQVEGQSH